MNLSVEFILVLALSTYRLSRFIVLDNGPFRVMDSLRNAFQHVEVLHCVHCASFWLAIVTVALAATNLYLPLTVLAVAGAVSLIQDLRMAVLR